MSKLDDLLQSLCPNGVEWKKLKEICSTITNYAAAGSFADLAEKVPYLTTPNYAQLIRTTDIKSNFNNKNPIYISKESFEFLWRVNLDEEDSIVLPSVGNVGEVYYLDHEKLPYKHCALAKNALLIRSKTVNMKFLKYSFESKDYLSQLFKIATTNGQGKFNKREFENLLIPVPPIEIQNEIVQILDKFTSLEAELEAELEARRKQYEYYRDSLLTFGDDVEIKKLGDFAAITRGGNFQKKDFTESGRPCIHYGQMYTHFRTYTDKTLTYINEDVFNKSRIAQSNDIVMAVTSENVEDVCSCVAWLGNEPIAVSGHTAIIHHNQNPKYLAYYFQTSAFFKQKQKLAHGTKVIEVTPDKLADIQIPVPSLSEQETIVSILDRFESLCNDITFGLPAEIEARHKQYEYYRDKLLTFKRKEA